MEHGLNAEQERAVVTHDGALLILAGAGAGKTRVIVHRIASLIKSGVEPGKILAVTFTNKAAREMGERVNKLLDAQDVTRPFIGTFHALSLHIIKTFHTAAGLPKRFTIYDRADSTRAVREAIKSAGFDPKQLEPRRVMSVMGRHKGNDVTRLQFVDSLAANYIDESIGEVWEKYDTILRKEKALDFDDILCVALKILRDSREAREYFQRAWTHIHVDEYQDTNRVQYELMKLLAGVHGNIAVIGDCDQNVYSWRGASIEFIMKFEQDYPSTVVVTLTQNYRSTKTILAAANDAIAKNINRKERELVTDNPDGEKIKLGGFADEVAEAHFVAHTAAVRIRKGQDPNTIAVLYRANFQSRVLEEAFLHQDIPYQVLGTRFFERKEVKDALSYLRAALNPDSVADVARTINVPARGIGKVTLARLVAGGVASLEGAQRQKVETFFGILKRIAVHADQHPASSTVRYALQESGLWRMFEEGDYEDEERLENIKELVTVATKYDTLPAGEGIEKLIEEAALQSDQDELSVREQAKRNGVKLMTVHAAKGLEFNTVFIVGLEEGLFPHARDGDDATDNEEERRLFYVALTRAEKVVYMTYALTRRIFGTRSNNMPSQFILELDPAYADVVTDNPWEQNSVSIY